MIENLEQISDSTIIEEIIKGNTDNFQFLIDKYGDYLLSYIMSRISDKSTAEEIVHNAFVKAYCNLKRFDSKKPFLPWISTIAKNLMVDYFREQKKLCVTYNFDDISVDFITEKNTPENILEQKENILQITTTLKNMKDKYRIILILKYIEDMSYEEISSVLGISLKKVKWQLYQARNLFIKEFNKKYSDKKGGFLYDLHES